MTGKAEREHRPVILIHTVRDTDGIDREQRVTVNADVKILTDGKLRNPDFSSGRWDYPGWHELADLRIMHAWRSERDIRQGYKLPIITTAHYSDIYAVELPQAEAMVKVLRRIARGMGKLDSTLGPPDGTPAGYLTRVASILKIAQFATHTSGGTFYDDGDTRVMDASAAHYHVTEQFAQFDRDQAERGIVSERTS